MKIVNNLSKTKKIMKNQKKLKRRTNRIVKRVSKLEHKVEELSKNKDKKLIRVDIEIISVRLIICILAMVLFYIPHANGFEWEFKLKVTVFFMVFAILYLNLCNMLSNNIKNIFLISLYYLLFVVGLISIMVILVEITFKLKQTIPDKYNILNYPNYMLLVIVIATLLTILVSPKQMRYDEIILKKILFINKQLLLLITIFAFFSINLTPESISKRLIMAVLFSIYPLTFMYNFFEFWNIKKDKKEEI